MGLWLVCMDRGVVHGCVRGRGEWQVRGVVGVGVDMRCGVGGGRQREEGGGGGWVVLIWVIHGNIWCGWQLLGSWSAASTWECDVSGAGAMVFGLCFLNDGGFERE